MTRSVLRKYLPLIAVALISSVVTSVVVMSYVFPKNTGALGTPLALASASTVASDLSAPNSVGASSDAGATKVASAAVTSVGSLPDIASVVERVAPTVVRIDTETVEKVVSPFSGDGLDGLFGFMFGKGFEGGTRIVPGTGSGFIVSADGYVVTNYHVIKGAKTIKVTLTDGREFNATVVGGDEQSDVAVLKIDATGLPFAKLGNSSGLKAGQWVIAIGNPYGFDHTVTAGIVSATGRSLRSGNGTTLATGDLIQTDAAINSGNSGGPLLDLAGNVVGINTAIIPYAQGMGFAIAIDSVKTTLQDLITYGKINKPWLGIWYQELNEELASSLKLADAEGVIVTDVLSNSPAQKAGLKRGDVIKEINGKKLSADVSLAEEVSKMKIGDKVTLFVARGEQKLYVPVTLGEYPVSTGTAD